MPDLHWLEIDRNRLRANLASIRGLLGANDKPVEQRPMLSAVVKADAYGLGAIRIARCLCDAGVDMLCVYSPDQAAELIAHGVTHPILILMPAQGPLVEELSTALRGGRIHLSIHYPTEMAVVDRLSQSLGCRVPIHFYLDTDMKRGGLTADQLGALLADSQSRNGVRIAGVYTHFASADTDPQLTAHQFELLNQAVTQNQQHLPADTVIHAANTCGVLRDPRYHAQMVRVGLGLFGYGPQLMADLDPATAACRLQPVVRWISRIVHIGRAAKGSGVGYGHTHRLTRDSFLGLVPAGYSDGYPLSLTNRSVVRVWQSCQHRFITAPVIGQVSMDQIIIDLTDDDGGQSGVEVGDTVELISNDPDSPCALPNLAKLAGTNCYEMLCRLSHIPRRYLNNPPTAVAG